MKILDRLERKFGRFAIPNLMMFVVITQLAVFICQMVAPDLDVARYLWLDRDALFRGEVWRIITFAFIPPTSSPIWIIFSLYFYFMIGKYLEEAWGSFKFNAYYFLGMLCSVGACLITGYSDNTFLNLSLFFVFAIIYPDFEMRIFFIIPIKVKYLAYVDAAIYLILFIVGPWAERAAIIASLLNLFIFMGGELINRIRNEKSYYKTRSNFRKNMWR